MHDDKDDEKCIDKIKMETNGGRNMAQRTDVTAMTTPIETITISTNNRRKPMRPFQFPFLHEWKYSNPGLSFVKQFQQNLVLQKLQHTLKQPPCLWIGTWHSGHAWTFRGSWAVVWLELMLHSLRLRCTVQFWLHFEQNSALHLGQVALVAEDLVCTLQIVLQSGFGHRLRFLLKNTDLAVVYLINFW